MHVRRLCVVARTRVHRPHLGFAQLLRAQLGTLDVQVFLRGTVHHHRGESMINLGVQLKENHVDAPLWTEFR